MAHEHGPHNCYCPNCKAEYRVPENVNCNTLSCISCGSRLRAVETGEFHIAQQPAPAIIAIDDQPINAAFFGEGRWLTSFITPQALEVRSLFEAITAGIPDSVERVEACWKWVTSKVKYVEFVRGQMWINGKRSVQNDLWTMPELTIHTGVGNCAVKSFLLTSLLRNELPAEQVYCTFGNLYNGHPGGHAWVTVKVDGEDNVMESTTPTAPPLVPASAATRYEPVHYFNDLEVYALEGRTQLVPMSRCWSTWLSDYLDWAWIQSQNRRNA
jgi:hypothetical protein